MKKIIKAFTFLLLLGIFSNTCIAKISQNIDKIIVFVNNNIITSYDFDQQITMYKFNNSTKIEPNSNIKNNILEQLIITKLELDLAKKEGIKVASEELDNAIVFFLKSQNMNKNQLQNKLNSYNITYDNFKNFINEQIIAEKLKQKNIDSKIFIGEDEINRILNSETFKSRVDYNLSYILINLPENATPNIYKKQKQIAIDALNELNNGNSFVNTSMKYSNANNALNGGNIGWKSNIVLPPQIANSLKDLKKEQITNIIELPIGFMIFKVNDIRSFYTQQIVKQYHVNHILIKVNETRSNEEALKQINQLYLELNKDTNNKQLFIENFTKLAKKYSEDASSINGGDIGFVGKSDTVPTFEEQVMTLPLYKLSNPVRTPFGWHLLYVDSITSTNKTTDIEKATIRQELREVKTTLLYAEWLRNLKDSAYIIKVAN
jgi:peptidyl-prolyl cis-trans isomerase SurA